MKVTTRQLVMELWEAWTVPHLDLWTRVFCSRQALACWMHPPENWCAYCQRSEDAE